MKSLEFVFFLFNILIVSRTVVGETKDEYKKKRNQFILQEKNGFIGGRMKLTDDELKIDNLLKGLKLSEINDVQNNDTVFPPETHFFLSKPIIDASPVFHLIKKMPKGGALHIHDSALVDFHWLIRRATYDPDCYMCIDDQEQLHFRFFLKPPGNDSDSWSETRSGYCEHDQFSGCKSGCQWQQVIHARKQYASSTEFDEKLYRALTMTVEHPDLTYKTQDIAWTRFRSLFAASAGLFTYAPVFKDYCLQALTEFYDDNIQYLEIRALLPKTYELDGTVHDSDWAMDEYQTCFDTFQKKHPDFLGAKIIFTSIRSLDDISPDIKTAMRYVKKYPSIFAGYDLVSQEDKGHSLYYFLDALLLPSQIGAPLRYFFHAGETDWEGISVDENLIDAILLNTSRIGHAFAIIKHPSVMAKVLEKGIALEISPISNQVLKLVGDLRDHPAVSLIAQDFPLVISSDDPALWGATGLSHDFYEVYMGIGGAWADLRTLKKLAENSIMYSAMSTTEKAIAMKTWQKKWTDFINTTIKSHNL